MAISKIEIGPLRRGQIRFDDTDFTLPRHALASGRSYVELEIRQDMLESSEAIAKMANLLDRVLVEAATLIGTSQAAP